MKTSYTAVGVSSLLASLLLAVPVCWAQSTPTTLPAARVAQQQTAAPTEKPTVTTPTPDVRKWSFSWGWNREQYSSSDIHFQGAGHDFTLANVQANDRQAELTLANIFQTYLNPLRITIPQTNVRLAYQYADNTAIAINLDHMKYVMATDQLVGISGAINGVAQSGNQVLTTNFLTYEHTDGLNVLSVEWEKQKPVNWLGATQHARVFGLVGGGIVVPKSNVELGVMGRPRNDQFHLAGYSAHIGAGFEADFLKRFFVRTTAKMGYVDLPDVWTSAQNDKASQTFDYKEIIFAVGARF
ncbi:hypothetical protein [Leptothrix ochracea]|uniref:hypothetical protein n=1 Tax=Leptothrix ochracea TaxID=735331 RepID=UPI0034E199E8